MKCEILAVQVRSTVNAAVNALRRNLRGQLRKLAEKAKQLRNPRRSSCPNAESAAMECFLLILDRAGICKQAISDGKEIPEKQLKKPPKEIAGIVEHPISSWLAPNEAICCGKSSSFFNQTCLLYSWTRKSYSISVSSGGFIYSQVVHPGYRELYLGDSPPLGHLDYG